MTDESTGGFREKGAHPSRPQVVVETGRLRRGGEPPGTSAPPRPWIRQGVGAAEATSVFRRLYGKERSHTGLPPSKSREGGVDLEARPSPGDEKGRKEPVRPEGGMGPSHRERRVRHRTFGRHGIRGNLVRRVVRGRGGERPRAFSFRRETFPERTSRVFRTRKAGDPPRIPAGIRPCALGIPPAAERSARLDLDDPRGGSTRSVSGVRRPLAHGTFGSAPTPRRCGEPTGGPFRRSRGRPPRPSTLLPPSGGSLPRCGEGGGGGLRA